jgi:hydrogenase nickel incorporation protein HypA/HybF
MHELSIATNIIEEVEKIAQLNCAQKILSIRLLIGPLSGIIPETLDFCFSDACIGTMAEGSMLLIDKSPLIIKCQKCALESEVSPFSLLCPKCNLGDIKIISGKEFQIMDIEVR